MEANKLFIVGNDESGNLYAIVSAENKKDAVKKVVDNVKEGNFINDKYIGHDTIKYIQMPMFYQRKLDKDKYDIVDEFYVRELKDDLVLIEND